MFFSALYYQTNKPSSKSYASIMIKHVGTQTNETKQNKKGHFTLVLEETKSDRHLW